ncbi:hypothetical protein B0H14DRAFT_2561785 [Mycena olivaceomarginata]|nr:hypothetical protein B0H14DRAFT_2561785 [Mycena olivaceomarginata]
MQALAEAEEDDIPDDGGIEIDSDEDFVTARSCLEVVVKAGSQSDIHVEYSVQHWHRHLRKAVEGKATWEDERMWNLFGQMVEKTVIEVWAENSLDVFVDVATIGWALLKNGENFEDIIKSKSNSLVEVPDFPWSPVLVSLTFPHLLVSRRVFSPCYTLPKVFIF